MNATLKKWLVPAAIALLAGGAIGLVAYLRRRAGRIAPAELSAEQRAAARALLADAAPQRPKNHQ